MKTISLNIPFQINDWHTKEDGRRGKTMLMRNVDFESTSPDKSITFGMAYGGTLYFTIKNGEEQTEYHATLSVIAEVLSDAIEQINLNNKP